MLLIGGGLFCKYMTEKKVPVLLSTYSVEARKAAGFGSPPSRITNNDSETLNLQVKCHLTRKEGCQMVVEQLDQFCRQQFIRLEGAAFGHGDFQLKLSHRHLGTSHVACSIRDREEAVISVFGCLITFRESEVADLNLTFAQMAALATSMSKSDLFKLASKASTIRASKNNEGMDTDICLVRGSFYANSSFINKKV